MYRSEWGQMGYDMLHYYFQAIPWGQLPNPEGLLSSMVQTAAACAAKPVGPDCITWLLQNFNPHKFH